MVRPRRATGSFPDFSGVALDHGRYRVLSVLGAGSYGKVYKAIDTFDTNQRFVAIKCLEKPEPDSREETWQNREFALHKKVRDHPNIITFHTYFYAGDFVFVVLDLCERGDLFKAFHEKDFFLDKPELIKSTMTQIIDAVQYCHERNIYHRDLKPENILLDHDGHVYLADFGLCTDSAISSDFGCGSAFYMSPESFGSETSNRPFQNAASDVWAIGVILVNIVTGCNPWQRASITDPSYRLFMGERDYLRQVLPISEGMSRILRGVFTMTPNIRISLPTLRQRIQEVDTFFRTDARAIIKMSMG
ncbi:kinase-like domain-containing protein [Mycena floridula]|nr:kinase-like domain-containing protein [Mycena floridula]